MLEIYVDGDACPVKPEVERVAGRHRLTVHVVSNGGLRPSRNALVRHVTVAKGADTADDWIAEHAGDGDIVITADIPLASRCLKKGASVLGPSGKRDHRARHARPEATFARSHRHADLQCGLHAEGSLALSRSAGKRNPVHPAPVCTGSSRSVA